MTAPGIGKDDKQIKMYFLACLLQYIHFTFDLLTPGDPALILMWRSW